MTLTITDSTSGLDLGALLDEVVAQAAVPGAAVALVTPSGTRIATAGVTSAAHPESVTSDTMFQIGSTTKTVTATALMHLVESGVVDLEEPVRRWVPELRLQDEGVAERVTLRHLLTHTGGWAGDHFEDHGAGDDALERLVAGMAALPQLTPLGSAWSYNNAGFSLAGLVLQRATGRVFEEAVRKLVLKPLGLSASFFAEELVGRRVASGHWVMEGRAAVATTWGMPRSLNSAGGLVCTIQDLAAYARFHLGLVHAREHVLRDDTRLLMQSVAAPAGSWADAVGLPWLIRYLGTTTVLSHGGQTNGQVSGCLLFPEQQVGLVCLTNSETGGAVQAGVLSQLLPPLGLALPEAPRAEVVPDDVAARLVGRYRCTAFTADVRHVDDLLVLDLAYNDFAMFRRSQLPAARLALVLPDRVVVAEGPMAGEAAEFLDGADGSVAWLRVAGRMARREATSG